MNGDLANEGSFEDDLDARNHPSSMLTEQLGFYAFFLFYGLIRLIKQGRFWIQCVSHIFAL